ncbi:MAG: flagellar basal body-associated FliL family protein [Calditrichaeota bacterium]|nr:flagellar basal body-associated FliL family protein [Calditrichota bacterium]
MKILIMVGILLAQTAAAYFIQKTLFFPDPATHTEAVAEESHGEQSEEEGKGGAHGGSEASSGVAMLDEIIVNPAGTGGRRFLSTIVGLTLSKPEAEKEITDKMPLIRDVTISLLASKTLDQLASLTYRDTLRQELQVSVNGLLTETPVNGIVFSTYVLQ